jgi:hypothetical protein
MSVELLLYNELSFIQKISTLKIHNFSISWQACITKTTRKYIGRFFKFSGMQLFMECSRIGRSLDALNHLVAHLLANVASARHSRVVGAGICNRGIASACVVVAENKGDQ